MTDTVKRRFWAKVDNSAPELCWLWTGGTNGVGYGRISRGRRGEGKIYAHVYAYELIHGPIPDGMVIDHLCRNPWCVNPSHLEAVTNDENIKRGTAGEWAKAKTHCPHGHAYESANVRVNSRGHRECRTCLRLGANAKKRRYRARLKAEGRKRP